MCVCEVGYMHMSHTSGLINPEKRNKISKLKAENKLQEVQ